MAAACSPHGWLHACMVLRHEYPCACHRNGWTHALPLRLLCRPAGRRQDCAAADAGGPAAPRAPRAGVYVLCLRSRPPTAMCSAKSSAPAAAAVRARAQACLQPGGAPLQFSNPDPRCICRFEAVSSTTEWRGASCSCTAPWRTWTSTVSCSHRLCVQLVAPSTFLCAASCPFTAAVCS